ncbi:hypothetical protein PG997_011979 [Apiospora hydei]|uniref:Ubiquitin-like domain-containing protein n=1 Tax=Apiospora hydei TaxID=1337664 RepID=A0ABR1V240_9PEZI
MASSNSKYACSIENDAIKITRTAPDTQGDSSLEIQFMRTIRVPDNNAAAASKLPSGPWPLYPRQGEESMWISFKSQHPFMIKVYAGDVNVVSGEHKSEGPETEARLRCRYRAKKRVQDYVVLPQQYCLDGVTISPGVGRQFEALPPGQDYGAETPPGRRQSFASDLMIEITPQRPLTKDPPPQSAPAGTEKQDNLPSQKPSYEVVLMLMRGMENPEIRLNFDLSATILDVKYKAERFIGTPLNRQEAMYNGNRLENGKTLGDYQYQSGEPIIIIPSGSNTGANSQENGRSVEVGAGGVIKQRIAKDWYGPAKWESDHTISIPVHILNPDAYQAATGRAAPPSPLPDSDSLLQRAIGNKQRRAARGSGSGTDGPSAVQTEVEDTIGIVNLHDAVDDPDLLISHAGPFRPFRSLADLEKELQESEPPET